MAAVVFALILASCGGGGGGGTMPAGSNAPAPVPTGHAQSLSFRVTIGSANSTTSSRARVQDVSAATNGVLVAVYANAALTTAVSQSAIDVSPGSAACNGVTTSPRTCIATVSLPSSTTSNLGPYWCAITTYGSVPVNGAFTTAAIGTSTIADVTLTAGGANQLSAVVAGVVASTNVTTPIYDSLPADGSAHAIALVLTPLDASGNPVGTNTTAYANPITVTLAESGGSGHSSLTLNGGSAASSATIAHSTDSVVLHYDGGGAPGYSTTVTIAAAGAAAQTITMSPMYVTSTFGQYAAQTLNFTAASEAAPFSVTEANAPDNLGYTFTLSAGCSGVASLLPSSGSGASSGTTVTSGATAAASGCTITFADSLATQSTIAVTVVATTSGGSLSVPVGTVTNFTTGITSIAVPSGIAAGPDGNVWFTESNRAQIGRITPSGVVTEFAIGITAGAGLAGITAGPDGNLWFTEQNHRTIGRITPAGTVTEFSAGITSNTVGITAGPDGNLWFTESPTSAIGKISTAGTVTEYHTGIMLESALEGIAAGPDGNLWFTEEGTSIIGRITPSGIVTEFPSMVGFPTAIASGPDSALWFTGSGGIGRMTTSGTAYSYSSSPASGPDAIVAGPDGNLWFTASGGSVARITTSGTVTNYTNGVEVGPGPASIVVGSDGNLWFTEALDNAIGRITP